MIQQVNAPFRHPMKAGREAAAVATHTVAVRRHVAMAPEGQHRILDHRLHDRMEADAQYRTPGRQAPIEVEIVRVAAHRILGRLRQYDVDVEVHHIVDHLLQISGDHGGLGVQALLITALRRQTSGVISNV